MINAATGQPDPCPVCGSTNVRWRGRRFYDIPFNFFRFLAVGALGGLIGTSGASTSPRIGVTGIDNRLATHAYQKERELYEARADSATPRRFWKCLDCKQHGEDFGSLAEDTFALRRDLAAKEDSIVQDRLGGAASPINRSGIADESARAQPGDHNQADL